MANLMERITKKASAATQGLQDRLRKIIEKQEEPKPSPRDVLDEIEHARLNRERHTVNRLISEAYQEVALPEHEAMRQERHALRGRRSHLAARLESKVLDLAPLLAELFEVEAQHYRQGQVLSYVGSQFALPRIPGGDPSCQPAPDARNYALHRLAEAVRGLQARGLILDIRESREPGAKPKK